MSPLLEFLFTLLTGTALAVVVIVLRTWRYHRRAAKRNLIISASVARYRGDTSLSDQLDAELWEKHRVRIESVTVTRKELP